MDYAIATCARSFLAPIRPARKLVAVMPPPSRASCDCCARGLIRKVSHTHRYLVTEEVRRIITALLSALKAVVEQLTGMAA